MLWTLVMTVAFMLSVIFWTWIIVADVRRYREWRRSMGGDD